MMNAEQTTETWQIEFNGQVIDTNFEHITEMIDHGELLRMDRVRKSDLRWIEAGKVPSLLAVFNAKDGDVPQKPVITLTKLGPTSVQASQSASVSNNVASNAASSPPANAGGADRVAAEPVCSMHDDVFADYVCGTCFSNFCKACPKSYGGSVKICPYCGAMCESLAKMAAAQTQSITHSAALSEGFGFSDFAQALAYPFKFRTSLIIGAVMFAFVSLGKGAAGFGGIFMMGSALGCYMLANTLTFGILSHTIENFAQGKIGEDFMPSFEDFSLWDDVVHPFFLSIGAWLVSFGPLFALIIVAFFFITNKVTSEMNAVQSDAAQTVVPELPYAQKAANQSQAVRDLLNRTNEKQKSRIEEMSEPPAVAGGLTESSDRSGSVSNQLQPPTTAGGSDMSGDDTEDDVMRANETIQRMQKAKLEGVVGKTPETKSNERMDLISTIAGYGIVFMLIGGVLLLWGLFYFPAACAVAGYTQSFAATVNPTVGFDTIRRLGVDYLKILLMCAAITITYVVVGGIFGVVFFAFDMPGIGNLPANFFASLFGFYFWIVFSCVLGFALYKAGDRLKLPS